MTAGQLKNVSLGVGAAVLLTFLFVQQQPVDPDEHDRFEDNLQLMQQLDAELNRDLLNSRYELLSSYDPFVQKLQKMRKAEERLQPIPLFVGAPERKEIEQHLKRLFALLSVKTRLLESFKSKNAILKILAALFSGVAGGIGQRSRARQRPAVAGSPDRLITGYLTL